MHLARRLLNIPPYPFARWSAHIKEVQRQGLDIIRLDIGSPDLPPGKDVITALCESAHKEDAHGYSGFKGIDGLRQAMADYYARRFGVAIDPNTQALPLLGSKEGIVHIAQACLNPGDVALVPDPGYAPYTMGAILAGAEPHTFPLLAENAFLPDFDLIPDDVSDDAVLMWLNYPNNPTGAVADLGFFERAVDFARHHDILLCHDAPYTDVTYGDYVAPSVLQVAGAEDVAVEFNSLSKTYNMAGWRMGMAVGSAEAIAALAQVKSNVDSGAFRPVQEAAVAALGTSRQWIKERNAMYAERLTIICDGLAVAGMEATRPLAALYAWASVPEGWTSEAFGLRLLRETGVAVAPGPFFGSRGEGYVRLSITAPAHRLQEAIARLQRFVLSAALPRD